MTALVFDVETTGELIPVLPDDDPQQPCIVQIAAMLCDEEREWGGFSVLVKSGGFAIPAEAMAIHGITNAMAEKYGVPIIAALEMWDSLRSQAEVVVAHNLDFDWRVINGEMLRYYDSGISMPHAGFCTMRAMTPICQIPGRYTGYKRPSLAEAYERVRPGGSVLLKYHDAMNDVRACAAIWRWLRTRETETKQEVAQ